GPCLYTGVAESGHDRRGYFPGPADGRAGYGAGLGGIYRRRPAIILSVALPDAAWPDAETPGGLPPRRCQPDIEADGAGAVRCVCQPDQFVAGHCAGVVPANRECVLAVLF